MRISYTTQNINNILCCKVSIINCSDKEVEKKTYENFIAFWDKLYTENKFFCFLFDASQLTQASSYYCYKIASFIKSFKKQKIQFLKFSIIIISNSFVRYLFNLIMQIEKPLNTVYIVNSINQGNELLDYKTSDSILLKSFLLINKIKVIDPD